MLEEKRIKLKIIKCYYEIKAKLNCLTKIREVSSNIYKPLDGNYHHFYKTKIPHLCTVKNTARFKKGPSNPLLQKYSSAILFQ